MSKTHISHKQNTLRWTKRLLFGLAATIGTTLSAIAAQAVTLNAGDILVADFNAFGGSGGVIRVDPTTGAQTEVSSNQFFDFPRDITLDTSGNILVADAGAFDERGGVIRVDPTTGVQTEVSSGGSFINPNGITLDASGNIIVSDGGRPSGGSALFRVDPITGAQTTVSSGFAPLSGNAVEASGDILVAELGDLTRVDPVTGEQTTFSGREAGGKGLLVDPLDIALEANGDIVVADPLAFGGSGGVIRVDPITGEQNLVSSNQFFVDPVSIAVVPIPEPSSILGLLTFGAFGVGAIMKRKLIPSCKQSYKQ